LFQFTLVSRHPDIKTMYPVLHLSLLLSWFPPIVITTPKEGYCQIIIRNI
jgi:hypothetical protein